VGVQHVRICFGVGYVVNDIEIIQTELGVQELYSLLSITYHFRHEELHNFLIICPFQYEVHFWDADPEVIENVVGSFELVHVSLIDFSLLIGFNLRDL
jgi:hypothetical protein